MTQNSYLSKELMNLSNSLCPIFPVKLSTIFPLLKAKTIGIEEIFKLEDISGDSSTFNKANLIAPFKKNKLCG